MPFQSTPTNIKYKSLHLNSCKLHGRIKLMNTRYVTFYEKLPQNQSFKEVKNTLVKKKVHTVEAVLSLQKHRTAIVQ